MKELLSLEERKLNWKIVLLFFSLFLIFIYIDNLSNLKEVFGFTGQKEYLKAIIYFANYIIGIAGIFFLLASRIKIVMLILLLFFFTLEKGFFNLSSYGFGYDEMILFLNEYHFFKDAFWTYYLQFLVPFCVSAFLVVIIYFLFRKVQLKYSLWIGLFLVSISFVVSYKIIKISNGVRLAYPVLIKEPVLLAYTLNNKLYVGKRDKVSLDIVRKPKAKHIIFIVDESIRGDKLSLNGFNKETTPFLDSIKSKILNFGVAVSGGICSSYSNGILLTGIQPNNLPDKNGKITRKAPLLFQYVNQAKMISSYFDMQNSKEKPNNFFQKDDWKYINHTFFIRDLNVSFKAYEKDLIGLKYLKAFINKHKNKYTFTYFVKQGAHFSYTDKYPLNKSIFKPTLKGGMFGKWNLDIKDKFLNTYYNAVYWEVDNFFKEFYKMFEGEDFILIYTSDHGQNLLDYLNIKQTHCLKGKAPFVMAEVPLFILSNSKLNIKYNNYNEASHFNIFGTLLYLMGYNQDEIKKILSQVNNLKYKLLLALMYASGLRVSEVCQLRVKDLDFGNNMLWVRAGKGKKDRQTLLPKIISNQIYAKVASSKLRGIKSSLDNL